MLAHTILFLLGEGADHGYRLKGRIDRLLHPIWRVNIGQVYQALERLRRSRWVEELPPEIQNENGHERWPVCITPSGKRELERWLSSAPDPRRPPGPPHNQIVGRLALGGQHSIPTILEGVARQREVFAHEHERIVASLCDSDPQSSWLDLAGRLSLEASKLVLAAHIEWLDLCRSLLVAAENDDAAPDRDRLTPVTGSHPSPQRRNEPRN